MPGASPTAGSRSGGEGLGPAEERPDAGVEGGRHPLHRCPQERLHPLPVRFESAEREVARYAAHLPRRSARLEQADHEAAALFAVVAVGGGVLEDRGVGADPFDGFGDEVVVLGGLVGNDDAVALAELSGPHAGSVDGILALDVDGAVDLGDADRGDPIALGDNGFGGDSLDDADTERLGAAGERHGEVDRVDPAVAGHVEAGEQVVGLGERELLGDLARGDLVDLKALGALEGGDPAILVQAPRVGGGLDEADRLETGGQAGLRLESGVEVAAVEADRGRGVRRRTEAGHQAGRVPGGAGREPVAFEDDDIGPPQMGQVIGDRRADDASADDDDPGSRGQRRWRHRCDGVGGACGRGSGGAHPWNLSLARPRTTPGLRTAYPSGCARSDAAEADLRRLLRRCRAADIPDRAARRPLANACG